MNFSAGPVFVNLSVLMNRPTGISTYALNVLPYLRSLHPHLLAASPFEGYPYTQIPAGLGPDHGWRGHLRRLWWIQTQLPGICQQVPTSLLFSPLPEAPLYRQCRTVVMVHDMIPRRFPQRWSPLFLYFHQYVPQVLREAQHILCNSEATARDVVNFCQIPAHRLTPILLAYDRSHFRPLDLPQGNYFLYVGRHDFYKNLTRLIAAFQAVAQVSDTELWIAGPTDRRYTPHHLAQVQELGLGDRVRFLDYLPYQDLPRVINQAIALVFPSLWEGFGLPVLEAMACGTPVITSNLSALPEVAGDAALLVDPYRVEAIAAAMVRLLREAPLPQHLQRLGLARAQQFSWERTGYDTATVLRKYL